MAYFDLFDQKQYTKLKKEYEAESKGNPLFPIMVDWYKRKLLLEAKTPKV